MDIKNTNIIEAITKMNISHMFQGRVMSFECIEKNQKIIDTFKCPVCLDFFKEPLMSECGHNFCTDCIKKIHGKPMRCCNRITKTSCMIIDCPMCRTEIHTCMLNKNINLTSTIDALQVRCLQKRKGTCSKEIYLEGIENHLKNDCNFVHLNCRYECGGARRYRGRKIEHELKCLKNPKTKIDCPDCSENVFAVQLKEHKTKSCPDAIVSCNVTTLCTKKIKRGELQEHIKNDCNEHIELLTKDNNRLVMELQSKEKEFKLELERLNHEKYLKIEEIEGKVYNIDNKYLPHLTFHNSLLRAIHGHI